MGRDCPYGPHGARPALVNRLSSHIGSMPTAAAVALGLAAGPIDRVLQGNKIDVTREHLCRSGRFYGCLWVEP